MADRTADEERLRWRKAMESCTCKHGVSIVEICFVCDQEFDAEQAAQHKGDDNE